MVFFLVLLVASHLRSNFRGALFPQSASFCDASGSVDPGGMTSKSRDEGALLGDPILKSAFGK